MSKIAISIALLPPDDIMDMAISINKNYPDDPIQLNKENCLPHISLCLGVVEENHLPGIEKIIAEIKKNTPALTITISHVQEGHRSFEVLLNKELQSLHETIISKLATYISYDATPEMFLEKEDVNPLTCSWVNNYQHNSSLAKYSPHITLLTNHTLNHQDIQKSFIVSQIAICQLGNYCTCRKILYTTNINP